ncbi:MAG: DUF2335 domain-containing protein [Desulfovibrio sp.]
MSKSSPQTNKTEPPASLAPDELLEKIRRGEAIPPESFALVAHAIEGPLPPPEMLKQYDACCPGLADRIVRSWESETEHRRGLELRAVEDNSFYLHRALTHSLLGLVFAFVICLSVVGGGVYLVAQGAQIPGSLFVGGGLAALVWAFINGSRMSEKTISEKRLRQDAGKSHE